jgi:hypothetical protein
MKELEKIEHDKNKPRTNKEEKKTTNKCAFTINLLSNIIFLIFFFFTILSLINMQPTNQTFSMRDTLAENFGSPSNGYLDRFLIMDDIMSRLKILFLDSVTKKSPLEEVNAQASPIRISFYTTKKKDKCPDFNITVSTECYHDIFDETTANIVAASSVINSGSCKKNIKFYGKNLKILFKFFREKFYYFYGGFWC